ncbi:MAG: hypothetical protein GY708_28545 [Actinomycetia bacterium]|nr:hypothetical protein [Actinomycetes bacterium]
MDPQRKAAAAIEQLGGHVVYDFEKFDGANIPETRPLEAEIDRLFGASAPEDRPKVVFAELRGPLFSDENLRLLHDLPHLEGLTISFSNVTDSGLAHLVGMKELTRLDLFKTAVKGSGLEYVASLPNLEDLALEVSPTENAGLAHLASAASLWRLIVGGTGVTDAEVPYLARIPRLTSLSIEGTFITGAGLRHLRSCKHLTDLQLGDRQLTREGIEHLKSMTGLRKLFADAPDLAPEYESELRRALPQLRIGGGWYQTGFSQR